MSRPIEVEIVSALDAKRNEVWRSVSTMKGVNFELHPFVHMTNPAEHHSLPTAPVPGQTIFRSWLLMFGVVPFDRHSLAFEHVEEGYRFVESSSSWLQRRWRHERILVDLPDGHCSVTDRLVIEPRLALARPLVAAVVSKLFQHRHRRLAKRFGVTQNVRSEQHPASEASGGA